MLFALILAASTAMDAAALPTALRAVRLAEAPVLDGDVLSDPAWASVSGSDVFWQTTPEEGQPASERTEVRVAFTADGLYVAVVCRDRDPAGIVVADSRRDASLEDTDSVRLVFDTFLDRENGFVFGTNPAGVEYDAQLVRQGGDRGEGLNVNWDGAWVVRSRSGDFGWSAEFEIPWKTLRYPGAPQQAWGLNVQRTIGRRKESAFWAPLQRQYGITRVSAAGRLEGVAPPPQRNLKLTPYVLGQRREASATRGDDGQVGADLKWSATPSLTVDLSANTDFAQVETDEQQVNLDRFPLFYPEKRSFFLENAGFFTMGSGGPQLFFSRRIGIGPEGVVVPILGGGRVSGRALGLNVGLLNMQTKRVEGLTPAQNFTAARLEKELPNRSGIAVLFTNRTATGADSADGDTGATYGAEGRLGLGRYFRLSGFGAKTDTPGAPQDGFAYRAGASWNSPAWEASLDFTEVGEGFDPQVGFLARRGYRRPGGSIFHRRRMGGSLGLHEIRPHASYEAYFKPDGFQESGFLHVDSHWEWRSGFEVHTAVNFTQQGLRQPFEIAPDVFVPPGSYDHAELAIVVITDQAASVRLDFNGSFGGFFGGSRRSWNPVVRARRGEEWNLDLGYFRNDVELPGGSFTTNLVRARLAYSFTPRITLQALVQLNDQADRWSTNLRFAWLHSANTGLFLVYDEGRDTAGPGSTVRDRRFTLKWSRLFDLLR